MPRWVRPLSNEQIRHDQALRRTAHTREDTVIVPPNLRDWVGLFFRRKGLFVGTIVVVLSAGGGYLLWATPQYRSEAAVVVRFDDKSFPQTDMAKDSTATVTAQADRHETVLAHADILTSPDQ